jgi:hypothetical protein
MHEQTHFSDLINNKQDECDGPARTSTGTPRRAENHQLVANVRILAQTVPSVTNTLLASPSTKDLRNALDSMVY